VRCRWVPFVAVEGPGPIKFGHISRSYRHGTPRRASQFVGRGHQTSSIPLMMLRPAIPAARAPAMPTAEAKIVRRILGKTAESIALPTNAQSAKEARISPPIITRSFSTADGASPLPCRKMEAVASNTRPSLRFDRAAAMRRRSLLLIRPAKFRSKMTRESWNRNKTSAASYPAGVAVRSGSSTNPSGTAVAPDRRRATTTRAGKPSSPPALPEPAGPSLRNAERTWPGNESARIDDSRLAAGRRATCSGRGCRGSRGDRHGLNRYLLSELFDDQRCGHTDITRQAHVRVND
jgi:hypothetical protein